MDSSGAITTHGGQAHAVFAQSVGGGGGSGGFSVAATLGGAGASVGLGGSGGAGQLASTVTVNSTGDLLAEGAGSHGILAQSVGGGGGNGGFSGTLALGAVAASASGWEARAARVATPAWSTLPTRAPSRLRATRPPGCSRSRSAAAAATVGSP